MSTFELPKPELREVVDYSWPVTIDSKERWAPVTEELARECYSVGNLLTEKLGEPLSDGYTVKLEARESDSPFVFVVIRKAADFLRLDELAKKEEEKVNLSLRLTPEAEDVERQPVVILETTQEHILLTTWGHPFDVTVRDTEFTVRLQQHWRLWDYHYAKKAQGYTEDDFPGSLWQPEYTERLIIVNGDFEGEDIKDILEEFDASIAKIVDPSPEPENRFWPSNEQWQADKERRNKIRGEIAEATGISPHTATGYHSLVEAHQTLAAIRSFVMQ